jgi:hypothetical protein
MNNIYSVSSKKAYKILIPFIIILLIGYFTIGAIPGVKALPTCRIADITTVAIAEPSFPSPSDNDGFPDGSITGNADPGDFQLVVRCDIDSTYSGVKVELLNPNHDPFNDESPDIVDLIIDDDNPKYFASLSTGIYYFYWSMDKDQSAALRGDAEQFQVNLSWTGPTPGFVLSDLFNIGFEQSTSIRQNDLEERQVSPTIVSVNPGETFRVCIKWEQSSSSLDDLAAEIYFNGSLLRLYNFSLYYYDVDGVDPGDITGGVVPSGWTQVYANDTYLNTTQLGALAGLSSSDYWIGCWDFEALTPGSDQLYLYSQTKLAATANWKIGQGTIPVYVTVRSTRITVIKDSIPDDPQDFTFDGNVTDASFILDDDGGSDATYMNYSNFEVDPGVYNVTEILPSGWILTNISIQDPSGNSWSTVYGKNATLLVGVGEWINVTFVNTKLGRITVIKNTEPDNDQDFSYATTGGLSPSSFTLDDDGDNTNTYSNNITYYDLTPGEYNITETVPADWNLIDISIDDHTLDSTYSLTDNKSSLNVGPGEWVNVTFTNIEAPEEQGLITIIKDAIPDDPQDFQFNSNSTAIGTFFLDDELGGTDLTYPYLRTFTVDAGSYNITEIVPAGWILYNITITDPTGDSLTYPEVRNATLVVAVGEVVTVKFENWKLPRLTIIKDAIPDDPQDFQIEGNAEMTYPDGIHVFSFSITLDDDTDPTYSNQTTFTEIMGIFPGTYDVNETVPSGWNLTNIYIEDPTGDSTKYIDTANASLVLGPGEWINVTFENTKQGKITVIKNSIPDGPQDFTFDGNVTDTPFILDDDGGSDANYMNYSTFEVDPGVYNVTEILPPIIWRLTDISIQENGPENSSFNMNVLLAILVVDPGEWVNVTFENSKCGRITVIKNTLPEDPQDFDFVSDIELFTLDDDGDNSNTYSNETTLCDADPGTYNITELLPGGWVLEKIMIQEDAPFDDSIGHPSDNVAEIKLSSGEWVNVTFINAQEATITVIKNTEPNDPQDFYFTGTGSIGQFSLDDDDSPTLPDRRTFAVAPGDYNITELVPEDFELRIISIIESSSPSDSSFILQEAKAIIKASPGESIYVTFLNDPTIRPVGGYFTSSDKLSLISPYLSLIAIAGAISALFMLKRHKY